MPLALDELPELINILKGEMSLIGPRPQLVRDMVYMTERQRMRHLLRPGLTGWAQVNGRNCIDWEQKLEYDLEYLSNMSFGLDVRIFFITIIKVFKTESISYEGMATAEDFGDYLLRTQQITQSDFDEKEKQYRELMHS